MKQAWSGPDLRQNTSQQLATLCSTLSEVTHALAEAELGYKGTDLKVIIILLNILRIVTQLSGVRPLCPLCSPLHHLTVSPKVKTLLSACSETVPAKPRLSVGEVQRETVEQVWVVSSRDRHMLSQARPAGTHLKSFSPCLQKHKKHIVTW